DQLAFQNLFGKITLYAIDLLIVEWEAAKDSTIIWTGACSNACDLPTRYKLPCHHWLSRAVEKWMPIPLSLIHPRWWLDGPAIVLDDWIMGYYDTFLDPRLSFVD